MPILSHVSFGVTDYKRAKAFYDAVLDTLNIKCLGDYGTAAGYGVDGAEFWIGHPHEGGKATAGNGTHVCFNAASQDEVDAFHAKAVAHGGKDDGKPGLRVEYMPNYYAAYVRDPDGNKIEAVCLLKD